ncbi:MAG: DUF1554 domain-containing protein [Nitrospinaceae bacterium]|nr:DUF1554 domain-containing protein [Nitrospinaceae bacterium]
MRHQTILASLLTVLFFIVSLMGNILISDPAFSNVAYAKKGDDDKDKDKDKGKKGLRHRADALETGATDLQTQINTIELTPGPIGPQGVAGPTGSQGPAGANGVQGLKGDTGLTGAQGVQGVPGANGSVGAQGPQGDSGLAGTPGIQGTPGTDGTDGATGANGVAGAKGDKGDPGSPGVAGADGATGPQGVAGASGSDGAQGQVGFQGPQGTAGADGVGDVKVVNVSIQPPFGPSGDYDASSACNGNGYPIEAGLLSNPNDPTRIEASVSTLKTLGPTVKFKIIINYAVPLPTSGDQTVQFWVKCVVPSLPTVEGQEIFSRKVVFLTSESYNGNLGGLAGADQKCQTLADSPASIAPPGTYKAWISAGNQTPLTRFTRSPLPYITNGSNEIIAVNFKQLATSYHNAFISRDEKGNQLARLDAWTGTRSSGEAARDNCNNWTTNETTRYGQYGLDDAGAFKWVRWSSYRTGLCYLHHGLYCVQQ